MNLKQNIMYYNYLTKKTYESEYALALSAKSNLELYHLIARVKELPNRSIKVHLLDKHILLISAEIFILFRAENNLYQEALELMKSVIKNYEIKGRQNVDLWTDGEKVKFLNLIKDADISIQFDLLESGLLL
jgi:hypothetical protein